MTFQKTYLQLYYHVALIIVKAFGFLWCSRNQGGAAPRAYESAHVSMPHKLVFGQLESISQGSWRLRGKCAIINLLGLLCRVGDSRPAAMTQIGKFWPFVLCWPGCSGSRPKLS
jgi:hypothetical protein